MSHHKLKRAYYSINECVKNIPLYSYASKADMASILKQCIQDLHQAGFMISHIKGLKPKHIYVLVSHWHEKRLAPGTIKNRMSKLRKLSFILKKPKLIKPSNHHYHIENRCYRPTSNKAITQLNLAQCHNPLVALSLEAQRLFGLRREEAIKIKVHQAWKDHTLVIKPSWTKGGVGRVLQITSSQQRAWLAKVTHLIPKDQSLIPKHASYKKQLSIYNTVTRKMGLKHCHGLRHAYAQQRYVDLTKQFDRRGQGLIAPIAGGKPSHHLSPYEKNIDQMARAIVSRELGHARLSITKVYLG